MTTWRLGRLRNLWRLTFHPSPAWATIPLRERWRFVLKGIGRMKLHSMHLHDVAFPNGCGIEECEQHGR